MGRDGRPRKTQEELDAEMEDYWGDTKVAGTTTETVPASNGNKTTNEPSAQPAAPDPFEVDMMIE